ncbi:MAG TPA: alanine--tRNA ligase [Ruminiclostridium sp.]|nr:alanine--tRNA ligase [Ruminiclostridium sp.]
MEWTGLNELREKYLAFFESKEHKRLPSFPLVPQGDKTLLLINAGMAPMKKFFLGQEKPPAKRVCTCQKCIRTPDIERVGKTARHGTFFEMLGNFSFGDYFKHEATAWAWEFITKTLEMPVDCLWVSIFENDDEAFDIWTKEVGVDPSHIVRFGREDNFWEHGSLPCGPCSEIYFDRGEKYGCGKPDCKVGCDCDRYVEFWNIVFQQFDSDGKGNYTPLKKPNIDTGMGLERLAVILQDVNNLFEVDTVQNIMKHISKIAGVNYGESTKNDVSLRVITDHIRSTTFMAADGILPSNEGRGYVMRRLLRRAARHGRLLGIKGAFLSDVVDTVIHENELHYPELVEKRDYIKRVISMEEERFSATIDQGLTLLSAMTEKLTLNNEKTLSGDDAFKLYDTYGFPLDLTSEILAERGIDVDTSGFDKLMEEQRERARAARTTAGGFDTADAKDEDTPDTEFVGYEKFECEGKVAAVISNGERAGFAESSEKISLILDRTPFYAESGGQVGDIGVITSDNAVVKISGCKKSPTGRFIHFGEVISGTISVGDTVTSKVDITARRNTMRNHSAAHLLQASLRKVLGNHVQQAGQLVDSHRVRFDFTHFAAMTQEELNLVEQSVNDAILSGFDVITDILPIEEARKTGAMALFGEKYGSEVRVVRMGSKNDPVSLEFCGGTHVKNTAQIGLFHIITESSVAAGVRRIEGATGLNLLEVLNNDENIIKEAAQALKASPVELVERSTAVMTEVKAKNHVIEVLNGKIAGMQLSGLLNSAETVGKFKVITETVKASGDALRLLTDRVKEAEPDAIVVLAGISGEKLSFAAACGKEAVKNGAHAGNIVRSVAKIAGGSGGGRPESAMAGGKDPQKADEALAAVKGIVASI